MAKKKKIKYYAIKVGRDVENKIVMSWDECQKLVLGYPAVYKSFTSEDEAKAYLGSIKDVKGVLEQNKKVMEHRKKSKLNTVSVANFFKGVRINYDIAELVDDKCKEYEITKEKLLNELLKEWVE